MRHCKKPLVALFGILTILQAFGQEGLMITNWEAAVDHSQANSCILQFTVLTEAEGPGTITATADGSFSTSGTAGSLSGSLYASATAEGSVSALEVRSYNFPGFGTLEGTSVGDHTASNGISSLSNPFFSFITLECDPYSNTPPPPCENPPAKQKTSQPCRVSPLVSDLGRNGFQFGGPATAVQFDIYGSGTPLPMHWVTAGEDDAFLVLDANRNGLADDGSELFGNGTRMILQGGRLAANGFVALGQFDLPELGGNNDGFIDHRDAVWLQLTLWLDDNADGISAYDEMYPLNSFGIEQLNTIPRDLNLVDVWGNWLPYWANVLAMDQPLDMVDVFFKFLETEPPQAVAD